MNWRVKMAKEPCTATMVLQLASCGVLVLGGAGGAAVQAGLVCPVPSSSLPGTSF